MLCHVAETSGVSEHTFVKFLNSFEVQEIEEGETIVKRGVQVKGWYVMFERTCKLIFSNTLTGGYAIDRWLH